MPQEWGDENALPIADVLIDLEEIVCKQLNEHKPEFLNFVPMLFNTFDQAVIRFLRLLKGQTNENNASPET